MATMAIQLLTQQNNTGANTDFALRAIRNQTGIMNSAVDAFNNISPDNSKVPSTYKALRLTKMEMYGVQPLQDY